MKKLVLTIAVLTYGVCQAQITVFGSLGTVTDTVSALYSDINSSDLYIGTRTAIAADRVLKSNGSVVSSTSYNGVGYHIKAIGTDGTNIIVFDHVMSGTAHQINGYVSPGWSNVPALSSLGPNFIGAVEDNFTGGSLIGGGFSGQPNAYTYIGSTKTSIETGLNTTASNIFDYTYHNGELYAVGMSLFGSGPYINLVKKPIVAGTWGTTGIPLPTWITLGMKNIASYGGNLFFTITTPQANYSDSLYMWDGITLTNTGIVQTWPNPGSTDPRENIEHYGIQDLEVHDGKLYVAGEDLFVYDGVMWTTIPVNGTVYTLESYGTKLAIGGAFDDLDGNPALDNLAYLEETVVTSVDVESSEQPNYSYTNGRLTIHKGEWQLYDLTGRVVLNGSVGTYTIPVGIYILHTEIGASKIAHID